MPMMCDESGPPIAVPGGKANKSGDSLATKPPVGSPGSDGVLLTQRASFEVVANVLSPDFTALLLHQIELDYLHTDTYASTMRLQWLGTLLNAVTGPADPNAPPRPPAYAAQKSRAATLARQMSLGLDYYGNFQNYVPLLRAEYYRDLLDRMFSYGAGIEDQYKTYMKADADAKQQLAALRSTQASVLANADQIEGQLAGNVAQQKVLQDSIDGMRDDIDDLWVRVNSAETAFKRAVANKGQGCDFAQIVAIGAAVASLVATGGSAAAAIGPALAALKGPGAPGPNGKPITDDLAGFEYEVKTVVAVGSKANDFVDAAKKVGKALQPTNPAGVDVPPLPSDETKLLAEAADIDKQLQPFLDIPEARTYQTLIHTFVSVSQARNNKILEFNSKRAEYARLSAQVVSMRADANEIQTKIAITKVGQMPGATTFMESAYLQAKTSIVRVMYEIDRCHRFYTLDATVATFNAQDSSMAALKGTALQQASDYNNALVSYGTGLLTLHGKTTALSQVVSEHDLAKFRTHGAVVFALPENSKLFEGYTHVLAQQVQVKLKGLPGNVPYQVKIFHLGRSLIRDDDGKMQVFSHVMVSTAYEVGAAGNIIANGTIAGEAAGGGNELFVGVSPYGPWRILVSLDKAHLHKIEDVEISFDAHARVYAGRSPDKDRRSPS